MTSAQNLQPRLSGNKQQRSRYILKFAILLLAFIILAACRGDDNKTHSDDTQQSDNNIETQDQTPRARVTVSRASVYLIPDREAPTISTLVEGDELPITGQTPPDALGTIFYFVQIGDQFGWILSSQVETSGNVASLPVLEDPFSNPVQSDNASPDTDSDTLDSPTQELPNPSPENIGLVSIRTIVADTPIYADPTAESEVLQILDQDITFSPIYKTPPDSNGVIYYGIEVPLEDRYRVGWLASTNVEITGDTTALVLIVSPTPTLPVTQGFPTAIAQDPITPTDVTTILPSFTPTSPAEISATTSTTIPTQQPDSTLTPIPTSVPMPLVQETEPLIDITLPDGWESGHFVIAASITTTGGDTEFTVSVYEGPLPNGASGTIWVFSGFSNLVAQGERFDLYPDANLILRAVLFRQCNIGLDVEQRNEYQIGQHQAIGARYVAVGCEGGAPDIAGWFAALPVNGKNYVFFVGIEPPEHELENTTFLDDILRTVQFLD